jgi:hypothetical protein
MKHFPLWTSILVGLILAVRSYSSLRNYEVDARAFTPKHLSMIEHKIGFHFPNGSLGLNMYNKQAPMDPWLTAKVKVPNSSIQSLVKELEQLPSERFSVANYQGTRMKWWHPSPGSTRVERRLFDMIKGDFVDLLLCEEDGQSILYIQWGVR